MTLLCLLLGLALVGGSLAAGIIAGRRNLALRQGVVDFLEFLLYVGALLLVMWILRLFVSSHFVRKIFFVTFIVAVAILVLVVLGSRIGALFVGLLALVIALSLFTGIFPGGGGGDQPKAGPSPSGSSSSSAPVPQPKTITGTTAECKIGNVQFQPLHYTVHVANGNFAEDGLKGETAAELYKANAALEASDPIKLWSDFGMSHFGKFPDGITNWQSLTQVGGKCLNVNGKVLLGRMQEANSEATIVKEPAPKNGHNSGVEPTTNRPYQEASAVITGDRTAVKVTYKNGTVVWYMKRCANGVTPGETPPFMAPPSHTPGSHTPGSHTPTSHGSTPSTPSSTPSTPTSSTSSGCKKQGELPANSCKDPSKDVNNNPSVPAGVKGCGADGCKSGGATDHPSSSAPPGKGSTGCGSSGNDPCPVASTRPADPTPTPGSDSPTPVAPGSGVASAPEPSASGTPPGGPPAG